MRRLLISRFQKPPFVGLIAFLAVFMVQPLGHIVMIVMENWLSRHTYWLSAFHNDIEGVGAGQSFAGIESIIYLPAFIMGVIGIGIIYWGVCKNTEIAGTWAGFIGATLLWTGWVEFSLHYHARYFGVKALCEDGQYAFQCAGGAATKPEYFLMQSSVGFLLVILLFFVLNKESRCNMFRWLQKKLRLSVGKPSKGLTRNFANIVAVETITILWFFYVWLMLLYDPVLAGEYHWLTYFSFVFFLAWAVFLIARLLQFKRVSSALRYAIPTAIIAYNVVEIAGRWNWFREFWVYPYEHPVLSVLVGIMVVGLLALSLYMAMTKSSKQA